MGIERVTSAVVDAGPIIHLAEIGCLHLLAIFEVLHIPDAVWAETVGMKRVTETILSATGNIQRHHLPQLQVEQFIRANGLDALQSGEKECLCLCQQSSVSLLLTDDLAVREAAKRISITPVGSLGVVIRSYRTGRLSLADAEQHLTALYEVSSLFVTRAIVETAIAQVRAVNKTESS